MDQHANGLITTSDHIARDGTGGVASDRAVATRAVIGVINRESKGIGGVDAAAAGSRHGCGISCDRPPVAAAATYRLQQEAMRIVAGSDDRAIDIGRHLTALATIASSASHAEAGGEITGGITAVHHSR